MFQVIARCHRTVSLLGLFCFLAFSGLHSPRANDRPNDGSSPLPNSGELQRIANKTIKVPIFPGGFNYAYSAAFPFAFSQPVDLVAPPGETNRLFVVERPGSVMVITNLASPSKSLFLDITDRVFLSGESGLASIAFHPRFSENGYFYVVYTSSTNNTDEGIQIRLSRFQVSPDDPNVAQPGSEVLLITQHDGDSWHQAGDLDFGRDGYLYVSIGDGGKYGYEKVQRIDEDFFGGILRLDVDNRPGNLPPNPHPGVTGQYSIPIDNPFVGATEFNGVPVDQDRVRTEFYAVGMRNPWRFSFDPETGDLYSNDTGSSYREEINLIKKGANYGWPFDEGSLRLTDKFADRFRPANAMPPIGEYGYEGGGSGSGKAITAGLLYRGNGLPHLNGAYVFSDFWTGDIGFIRPGTSEQLGQLRSLQSEIKNLEEQLLNVQASAQLRERQAAWETQWLQATGQWAVLKPMDPSAFGGASFELLSDNSLLVQGELTWSDIYTVHAYTKLTNITAVRLEIIPDDSLPGKGPGRSSNGNPILAEFEMSATSLRFPTLSGAVALTNPTADFSQRGWSITNVIDGKMQTGWAISPAMGKHHEAVFHLKQPLGYPGGTILTFKLKHLLGSQALIGRFRLSVTTASPPPEADRTATLAKILLLPKLLRSASDQRKATDYYFSIDPEIQLLRGELANLQQQQLEMLQRMTLPVEWIMRAPGIASLSTHPASGELLMVDMMNGEIWQLKTRTNNIPSLPATLKETGIFSDLETLTPEAGVVPYFINVPFWSDNAIKKRWFATINTNQAFGFKRDGNWYLPAGTVWIKHFDLELTNGVPSSARRMETRVLMRHPYGVHGLTYRWDKSGSNATLVPDGGLNEHVLVQNGSETRHQIWRYPSRAECLQCHTSAGGYALSFNTAQLNRLVSHGTVTQNQIEALSQAHYFSSPVTNIHTLPKLASLSENDVSAEFRMRSYLQANCAQCHQPGGPGRSIWDARITSGRTQAGLINGMPIHGITSNDDRLVKPGSLEHSVLWQRLSRMDHRHMPPLGTSLRDEEALALLSQWITNDLSGHISFKAWQAREFEEADAEQAEPKSDPDGDGISNYVEYLTDTDPLAPSDYFKLSIEADESVTHLKFNRLPNLTFEIQWSETPFDAMSWKPLETNKNGPTFPSTETETVFTVPKPNGKAMYFRLMVHEP